MNIRAILIPVGVDVDERVFLDLLYPPEGNEVAES